MKSSSKNTNITGQVTITILLILVVLIIVVGRDHPSKEDYSDSISSSTRIVEKTEGNSTRLTSSSSAADEAERSRLMEEIRKRLETISERSQISVESVNYPDDPYHVFDYDDPDAFWWDWGDEFGNYDDCYEYWDRAWGNLQNSEE